MGAPEECEDTVPDGAEVANPEREEATIPDGFLKNILVAASLGAGGIHLWAAWSHSAIARVLVFFTLVAALQLWLAAVVVWIRSVPWSVLIAGAVVNAVLPVVWVLSRTTGVPFQPDSHGSMSVAFDRAAADPGLNRGAVSHQETFGFLDTAASLLEVAAVVAVLVLWLKHRSRSVESGMDETAASGDGSTEDPVATISREVHSSMP